MSDVDVYAQRLLDLIKKYRPTISQNGNNMILKYPDGTQISFPISQEEVVNTKRSQNFRFK